MCFIVLHTACSHDKTVAHAAAPLLHDCVSSGAAARALAHSRACGRLHHLHSCAAASQGTSTAAAPPAGRAVSWVDARLQVMELPIRFLVRFWVNHHLLDLLQRPVWRVVSGRSRSYVDAILKGADGLTITRAVRAAVCDVQRLCLAHRWRARWLPAAASTGVLHRHGGRREQAGCC